MTVAHESLAASLAWTFEPVTVASLVASALLYAWGVRALWRNAGAGEGIRGWQVAAFAAGIASLAIALVSPMAWLSELLFSAHMTQHEILMLVAAPLLVVSQPLVAFLWALPSTRRSQIARAFRRPPLAQTWRMLTEPLAAFLVHGLVLWLWHVPALFEAALASEAIHAVQHLSFVLTAGLFWWGMVHGRYGRAGYGVAALYVFLTAMHTGVLGALLTVAPRVWYPTYASRAPEWGVHALEDQQLAGLIMWAPSGAIFIVLGLALLSAWLGESERRAALSRTAEASRPRHVS